MADERVQRRLAAILAADVVGYSRLMGEEEEATLATLKAYREIIDGLIADHDGRVFGSAGDSVVAEFASPVEAVRCATAIQPEIEKRNTDLPEARRMRFRIGVNLGDVVVEGENLMGDGVNIAARMENLCKPGEVYVSGTVYDHTIGKVLASFEDLGEQKVKNIARPIRVYVVRAQSGKEPNVSDLTEPLPLPDKPSIAVLPFENMSGDPEQGPFADGMTEDVITDLSKVSGLFVVARNSSFAYKGKSIDVRIVAAQLGVRYVLEGSVRKSGDRVRINAQLIDSATGGHLWADRYDGSVGNVFELQDEVGAKVVSALSVRLTRGETERLRRVHTNNLDAYELFVRARTTPYPPVPERIYSALKMFETVIEMDPEFSGGYAGVSSMLSFGAMFGHGDTSAPIEQALKMAQKAISVDETFGWSYTALGMALLHRGEYADAIAAAREAITCQPSDADAHAYLGLILGLDGQYATGVDSINQALRLNPHFFNGPYLNQRLMIQLLAGDDAAAIETFRENLRRGGPVGPPPLSMVAGAYTGLGRLDEAAKLTGRLRDEAPAFSTANWNLFSLIRDVDARERLVSLMRAAGVPES